MRQRLQLPGAVVNDAHRGSESQLHGALAHHQRILRIANAAAHHGVDVHVKIGVFGQQLELLVQHLQALLRNIVRHDVVDADLQVVEPGAVQPLDALGGQQIAVGDHARDHAAAADVRDDLVQIGMQQRLAAADGDDGGAQRRPGWSRRWYIVSSGTGLERSSNSLQ